MLSRAYQIILSNTILSAPFLIEMKLIFLLWKKKFHDYSIFSMYIFVPEWKSIGKKPFLAHQITKMTIAICHLFLVISSKFVLLKLLNVRKQMRHKWKKCTENESKHITITMKHRK